MGRTPGAVLLLGVSIASIFGGIGASCSERKPTPSPSRSQATNDDMPAEVVRPKPDLRLVVVTDLAGTLEPCGCTSHPLGGIDRMAARIKALRADGVRTVVVAAGNTFFGQQSHAKLENGAIPAQESWKADVIAEIFGQTRLEALQTGPLDPQGDALATLTSKALRGAASTDESFAFATIDEAHASDLPELAKRTRVLADSRRPVLVALVSGSRRFAREVAQKAPGITFVINGGVDSEKPFVPFRVGGATVVNAGQQGQGVVVLDLYVRESGPFTDWSGWSIGSERQNLRNQIDELEGRVRAWEKDSKVAKADVDAQRARLDELKKQRAALVLPASVNGNAFVARWVSFDRKAPQDPATTAVMKSYDKHVNEHNRVAYADVAPPPPPPGAPSYIGSAECASCHKAAYDWWTGHKHGRAYKTLVDVDKQFNLSCVGCHVTGYDKPGGSTVTHNLDGALVNVGCESCHGPGSAHAAEPKKPGLVTRATPETTCIGCHNMQHSDLFSFPAYRAMLMVPGHGMPVAKTTKSGKP